VEINLFALTALLLWELAMMLSKKLVMLPAHVEHRPLQFALIQLIVLIPLLLVVRVSQLLILGAKGCLCGTTEKIERSQSEFFTVPTEVGL
jgi:hypothetical protein